MIGGVTRLGGLPGLLGRVTLLAGVAFCHVNVSRWGNSPTRGLFMLPKRAKSEPTTKRPPYWNRNSMFQSRGCQRGELFRRVHLLSVEGRNQDGNQEESEGIQISSDALSEGPIEARASSLLRDQSITQSNEKRFLCQRKSCCEKKKNKTRNLRHAIFSRKLTPGPRGDKIACKRELFFDHGRAGYLTYPGSPTSM